MRERKSWEDEENTSRESFDWSDDRLIRRRPRIERPLWVKMGVWGLPTRTSVWVIFWLTIVVSIRLHRL